MQKALDHLKLKSHTTMTFEIFSTTWHTCRIYVAAVSLSKLPIFPAAYFIASSSCASLLCGKHSLNSRSCCKLTAGSVFDLLFNFHNSNFAKLLP